MDEIGKFYTENESSEQIFIEAEERLKFERLKKMYLQSKKRLERQILVEEIEIKALSGDEAIVRCKYLQPMYERYKVACEYEPLFEDICNYNLLLEIYYNGSFVAKKTAKEIKQRYEDMAYFQSKKYQKRKKLCTFLSFVFGLIFIVLPYKLYGCMFVTGILAPAVPFIVIALGFYAGPSFAKLIVFGDDKMDPEYEKTLNSLRAGGTVGSIIGGIDIANYRKKIGEPKFKE